MLAPTFTDVLRVEVAALQATHPDRLGEIARAHASIIEGHVIDTHDGSGKVLSRNGHTWYTVNGKYDCTAAEFGKPCRHLSAWRLYKHIQKKLETVTPASKATTVETPESTGAPQGIPAHFFTTIQGKPFVRFEGLLHVAHEHGLVALNTTTVHISSDLVICQSVVKMRDGSVFTDIGDATPQNVKAHLQPHWIRIAAMRATARALRRALNIDAYSVEELGDD